MTMNLSVFCQVQQFFLEEAVAQKSAEQTYSLGTAASVAFLLF